MIFNVQGERAKQLARNGLIRQMVVIERIFIKNVRASLNRQYFDAARAVTDRSNIPEQVVDKYIARMQKIFKKNILKTVTIFGQMVFDELMEIKSSNLYEMKDTLDDFWREMDAFIITHSARKVTEVSQTTKRRIRTIVGQGVAEGLGVSQIATQIRKRARIDNVARARMIARTETHTAAMQSMESAVKAGKIRVEKEWVAALDQRTRRTHLVASGQRIDQDDTFMVGEEKLRYPGDSRGSAKNIINCRCVPLYHTKSFAR